MTKTRTLTEAEEKARKKYGGLTRRQYNAQKSKFANHVPKARNGSFEIMALFDGNPVPQTAPFPNESAALVRFEKLSTNPNVLVLKLIENVVVNNAKGEPVGMKQVPLYVLHKQNQQFANSKSETVWRKKDGNATYTKQALEKSDALMAGYVNGDLVVHKIVYTGGSAWWESRA